MLYSLASTHDGKVIKLGPEGKTSVSFEVDYDILQYFIDSGMMTSNALYTWQYSHLYVNNRRTSNYFNDFNLIWNSEREIDGEMTSFAERFEKAYNVIDDIIKMVPKDDTNLKVEFYARTEGGIDKNLPITGKPDGIHTDFKVSEFSIDPSNPAEAIISMLFWMMMEPNIFSVVKWGGENLIYLDIYNLFGQDHVQSGTIAPENRINGLFAWTDGDPTFLTTKYNEFKERFAKCFEFGDIMHFLGFHNHELDPRFNNIIDYIMDKVLVHFISIGTLKGISNPKIFDLRA